MEGPCPTSRIRIAELSDILLPATESAGEPLASSEAAADEIGAQVASGTFAIVARHSRKVWDVAGASYLGNAPIIQWAWHGGNNQRWRVGQLAGSTDHRMLAVHSSLAADVAGASTNNWAAFVQWPSHGGNNQRFRIVHVQDVWYRIVARHSGKVADVFGASTNNDVPIIQWPWHGGWNQQFAFTRL
jgi:hypothetical protein